MLCHVCPDGHCWVEQDDGTVSPSYGYGGTQLSWPGYDPKTCPEPKRDRLGRYRCPSCGGRIYAGHCSGPDGEGWAQSVCEPPPPACGKPPAATFAWVAYNPRRKHEPHGWVDATPGQLPLDPGEAWTQPADAIRTITRRRDAAVAARGR